MTALDHFQAATVLLGEACLLEAQHRIRKSSAQQHLREAIAWIDRTGEDQHMRADLAALLATISTRTEQ